MLSKIRYILLLLCLSLTTWMSAQQLSDQATISLITCTPGNELYARYGHTAIRVCDPLNQLDVVFNYGIFDFNDEHFYLKFLRGETYYQLGLQYTNDFRLFYGMEKRPIYEQTLNLTPEQRNDIWSALLENYRPENRRYLYNFVFDNCATRPYYLLCRALRTVPEESTYEGLRGKTFRHAIQHYTRQGSWADLGINLIFGPKADCRMTDAERLFLPEELMFYVATITCPNGEKLVQGGEFKVFKIKRVHWYETWYFGMSLLCLLVLAVTLYDRAHYRLSIWFDVLVGVVYGVLLLIVFLLTFFSIHPLVGFGWRLLVIPVVYCSLRSVYWWPKPKHRHHHSHHHHHHHHHSELIEHHSSSSSSRHASSSHHSSHHSSSSSSSSSSTSHHHHHHHHRTTTALVLLLCSVSLVAEQRLTVLAVVDGLCEPNMQQLRQQGNPGGLYTLIQEADHYTFRYSQLVQGGQETTATILTGAQPIDHGYMDDSYYSRSEHRVLPVLYDPQVQAIGCSTPYSPEPLMMPTLTDYWRMRYPTAHIYAVGLQPECTVLMAGHSANGCCWIDMSELQWASTSFYKSGLPTAALRQNQKHTVREQASQRWRPYRYDLHDHLLRSPQANQLTTQLALDILEQEHLGTDAVPDMLLIQLTTLAPSSQQDVVHNAEHADMQHSVSKQLSLLMQQLDQRVGHDRYNLLVIGRPVYGAMGSNMRLAGMPERRLTCDQVSTLLGMYLTALYGNERWVEQMHGQSVYLNLQAVQRHGLSLPVVQQTVASFLMEFEGIQVALTQAEAFSHVKMQQSVSKRFVGDVFFVMQPNWRLCLNEDEVYDYNIDMSPSSPVYWWQAGHRAYDRGELTDNQLFNILGLN